MRNIKEERNEAWRADLRTQIKVKERMMAERIHMPEQDALERSRNNKEVNLGLTAEQAMHCVIAYEPLWAIGTGNTATSAQAQEVCAAIRATLGKLYDPETAKTISILYGGSMNAGNAAELLAQPDIDGGLIGGASLKPVDFSKIVAATAQGACE